MRNQKRRVERTTILVYGEGSNEEAWLKYIKRVFAERKPGITIKNGGGGSPTRVIREMMKNIGFAAYDKKYVLVDSDREEISEAVDLASQNGIEIIKSEQCLEVELLKISGVSKNVRKRII